MAFIYHIINNPVNRSIDERNKTQLGVNIKSFGAKGDGVTDDTAAIETAFNSNVGDLYFPRGTYKISAPITVMPGEPRKVLGRSDVVISASLKANQNLFKLDRNLSFENIDFDFNHGYLQYGIYFNSQLGEISLKNVNFRNIKDTNSSISTIVVYVLAKGNQLNLQDISFDHMLKKGNGIITDGAGNLTCLYVTDLGTQSEAVGHINSIRITNVHNINGAGDIIYEDTSGIYVLTSENDYKNNIKIKNIYGYNFGKRLIKLHASNIKVNNISAYSDTNDALSVVGINSGEGLGDKVNTTISDVTIRGKVNVGLASSGSNTTFRNIDVNIKKTLLEGNNSNGIGVLISGDNTLVENSEIDAPTPLLLRKHDGLPVKNVSIKNVILSSSTKDTQ
ncbi:glycosyl hydrolase family 28-related protein [Priestia filamentosa]|uniref:glycosyl hydrolase family 28-related protein n=1 Tax=Priestia filamentosa TaxID=1402861 RepID=UPI002E1FA23E|nr:glycosyl hydrolase family 28-related protein [Priestia filamentosa]